MVERAPDSIFIQTEIKFAFLNPAACKLFGIESPDKLIGSPVMDRFHPDSHKKIKERIRRLNEERQAVTNLFEQKFIRVDGSEVWVESSGVPITYQEKNGALVFVRDITQRKQAERI
ncbi:MAG: PAS domain S-box protein [Bacteroidales bacterium]|nr:PAS domain S-box protein [Bacteroidales bacterium]